jgi:hypothetical protein
MAASDWGRQPSGIGTGRKEQREQEFRIGHTTSDGREALSGPSAQNGLAPVPPRFYGDGCCGCLGLARGRLVRAAARPITTATMSTAMTGQNHQASVSDVVAEPPLPPLDTVNATAWAVDCPFTMTLPDAGDAV